MLAATAAALQQLHQSGLGTSPSGEALTLGLLAAAAFRGLHLALYRPFYTPAAWGVQAAGVGLVVALAAALYSAIAAASFEADPASATPRTGLTTLAPKPGLPLSAGYAAATLIFLAGGVILGALPPSVPASVFAGGDPGALLTAMRGAFASGLVFPGAVAAWGRVAALSGGAEPASARRAGVARGDVRRATRHATQGPGPGRIDWFRAGPGPARARGSSVKRPAGARPVDSEQRERRSRQSASTSPGRL